MKKNTIITFIFTLALLLSNLTVVFADDGIGEPSAAPDSTVVEAPAEPAQEAAPEAPAAEETAPEPAAEEEAPAEESEAEELVEEAAAEEPAEEAEAEEPAEEAAEETPVEEQATEQQAEAAAEETPVEDQVAVEPSNDSKKASAADQADTETAADGPVEEAAEEVVAEPAEEEAVVEEESLADVVDALNEKDVHIVDENGEPVAMASVEAEEMLQSKDPFFWLPDDLNFPDGPGKWVGYTSTGTGCPVNVECNISATPFKQAVSEAPNGSMIYVAQGHYAENVVVDNANLNLSRNLSFTAFSSIAVSASSPIPTNIIGANATVDQITLNVNFDTTYGVYANLVTVNDEGGLDDAMQLVSYDGRIEAEMYIYGPVDSPRVRDENNTVDFELECGEPDDTIIINRKYRMTLMRPYDPDIVAFYETQVDDGRTTPISSLGRIEDLRIAVNVSEDNKTKTADPPHFFGEWYDEDEKQIYWYLLGNTEFNTTNSDIQNFSDRQKEMADEIAYTTDWDDVTRYWDVWFMNPPTNNNNKAIGNKQLTFFVYDPRDFGHDGCMDPEALNYDPYATYQDLAICEYPIDPPTTTTTTTPGDPVFVAAVDEVLIPVTGADLGMQAIVPASGLLLVGISFLMKGWMDNKKK